MSKLIKKTIDAHDYIGAKNLMSSGFQWLERTIRVDVNVCMGGERTY